MLTRPTPQVVVDDVCAWPELAVLQDDTLIAAIHNQPSHLHLPGDVDCWASHDGGMTWEKRGTPAPRDTDVAARGHIAIGTAGNGDLIVITTGWSGPFDGSSRGDITPTWISRSDDGGYTWTIDTESFPRTPTGHAAIPHGNIISGGDGVLLVATYGRDRKTYIYRSSDDGRTWGEPTLVDAERATNEVSLLYLGDGRLLAAVRMAGAGGLMLYASDDNGKTWSLLHEQLTGPQQHPGHLTRLSDGRLLLSYGNRAFANRRVPQDIEITSQSRGVDVRFSSDDGKTWSAPYRVVDFEGDGGYPSSIQLAGERVLTAYYARKIAGHDNYHMGVVIWDPSLTPCQ